MKEMASISQVHFKILNKNFNGNNKQNKITIKFYSVTATIPYGQA